MTSQWTRLAFTIGIAALGLWIPVSSVAGEFPESRYRALDARWRLNPAGQLELRYDPLHNGRSFYGETYTVILNDRAPKMCGGPGGPRVSPPARVRSPERYFDRSGSDPPDGQTADGGMHGVLRWRQKETRRPGHGHHQPGVVRPYQSRPQKNRGQHRPPLTVVN